MTYPFITLGILIVFIFYAFYLLVIKKDKKRLKSMLVPAVFFLVIWGVIYYFLSK